MSKRLVVKAGLCMTGARERLCFRALNTERAVMLIWRSYQHVCSYSRKPLYVFAGFRPWRFRESKYLFVIGTNPQVTDYLPQVSNLVHYLTLFRWSHYRLGKSGVPHLQHRFPRQSDCFIASGIDGFHNDIKIRTIQRANYGQKILLRQTIWHQKWAKRSF